MLSLFLIYLKIFLVITVFNLHNESVVALSVNRKKRSVGVKEWYYLWPEGRVPFTMNSTYNGSERKLMKQAMNEWQKYTCLKFMERENHILHEDFIHLTKTELERCYTNGVGRRNAGKNDIYLGEKCITKRIIMHELGHAIGLHHEHRRPDRDEYVQIHMENVKTENHTGQNFDKLSSNDVILVSQKYDYDSIMHYSVNAFARNRSKDTITPLKSGWYYAAIMGNRERLSDDDIRSVNSLYNCSECGGFLTDDSGTIEVLFNSSTSTTTTKHCEWSIVASRGELIIINVTSWSIFGGDLYCTLGSLVFKDEFITGYNFIGNLCGKSDEKEIIQSRYSRVLVTYHANHINEEYYGFKLNFYKICKGDIEVRNMDDEYFLESPSFPNQYPPNKRCVWHIVAPLYKKLVLKFNYFKLESSDNCKNDYVEIRDGGYYSSRLIGRYCNNTSPGEIWSSGYTLYVKFVSNGKVQDDGFAATAYLRGIPSWY